MCDINGPFKLCTCSEKIDKKKPYWVLKSNREDDEEDHMVLGMFSEPNIIFTPIVRRNILRRLNTVKSIFYFDIPSPSGLRVFPSEVLKELPKNKNELNSEYRLRYYNYVLNT